MFLTWATVLFAQQQSLPSAPDPKPSPSPFKTSSKPQPVPPAVADPDKDPEKKDGDKKDREDKDNKDKDKKDREEAAPGLSDVLAEPLDARQQLVLKDYFSGRLVPAIRSCWYRVMPEEAYPKRRPLHLDRKGKSGKVRIEFTLHKDGSVTDAGIENSSGDKVLDQAALNAVKECRTGSLPSAFSRETVRMHFNFYYNP